MEAEYKFPKNHEQTRELKTKKDRDDFRDEVDYSSNKFIVCFLVVIALFVLVILLSVPIKILLAAKRYCLKKIKLQRQFYN